jgi:hypothetical protein
VPSDFLFAIEVSDDPASSRILADLAAAVFAYAGIARGTGDELTGALRQARAGSPARGRCQVRFQAASGTLTMFVSCDGGPEWQTTRPLP